MEEKNIFENVIADRAIKEKVADTALALLANDKMITLEKDLNHLVVEFGYLLKPKDTDNVAALMKIKTQKKLFKPQKIFYIAVQKGELMILNEKFNENLFRKTSQDMLMRHNVDLNTINRNQYIMELY